VILSSFHPHPKQRAFFESKSRFRILSAGARAGKTAAATAAWVQGVFEGLSQLGSAPSVAFNRRMRPRALHWCVAPNYSLLQEAIRYTLDYIPESARIAWYDSELTLWLKGFACLQFKSADHPESLVSVALDSLLCDEAARVPADAWRGQLRQRLVDKRGRGIFATTPLSLGNWVNTDLIKKAGTNADYEAFKFSALDNPYLSIDELEAMRREIPDRYAKREIDGDWASWQGLVYDEFDPAIHVVTREQVEGEYGQVLERLAKLSTVGGDWGWTDPFAMLTGIDTGQELLIVDEVYESHLPLHDAPRTVLTECDRVRNQWRVGSFIFDPSRPDSIAQLQRSGFNSRSGYNDIDAGVRRVAERLHVDKKTGRPRLRILNTCKNLIREMQEYVWFVDRQGQVDEKPDPRCDDHGADALRYLVCGVDPYKKGPLHIVGESRDASVFTGASNPFGRY